MSAFSRFLVASLCLWVSSLHAEQPPNVVLIISDDHHWADYGFMGHPEVKTPHLEIGRAHV